MTITILAAFGYHRKSDVNCSKGVYYQEHMYELYEACGTRSGNNTFFAVVCFFLFFLELTTVMGVMASAHTAHNSTRWLVTYKEVILQ